MSSQYTAAAGRKKRSKAVLLLFLTALIAFVLSMSIWKILSALKTHYAKYSKYDELILEAGYRNGVDPCLLKAVIWRESRFDRTVIGSKGEIGLMQVMPRYAAQEWADAHGIELPSNGVLADPAFNLEVGSWYLGRALRRWSEYRESLALALCEYNAGFSRAEAWKPLLPDGSVIDKINISSTRAYVNDISNKYSEYKKEWDYSGERKDGSRTRKK